jgi:RimJ/RimL family protein N-acetyltransferase
MGEYYSCKLDKPEQLIYFYSDKVRWLDLDKDWDMIFEYYKLYPGDDIRKEDFMDPPWKLCAFVEDGRILSYAGCLYMSDRNWEIGAVGTHPEHRNKGYAKMVCSYIAKYILDNNKRATCNTGIHNTAMQRVMKGIGMVVQ